MNKPRECPLCKSSAEEFEGVYLTGDKYGVCCTAPNCGLELRGPTAKRTLAAWNRRPTDGLVDAVREYARCAEAMAQAASNLTDGADRDYQSPAEAIFHAREAMFAELAKREKQDG
jgi:hypothetical protein